MSSSYQRLLTRLSDINQMKVDEQVSPELPAGAARLRLSLFSLTTNNITYAVYGEQIGYWGVFPTQVDDYGHMPVWGFADVVESRCEGVPEGARVWGYFPIADEVTVFPDQISGHGFLDSTPCRRSVSAIYNRYVFCSANVHYQADLEPFEAIYRPLFFTSYIAAEFLREQGFFGARQILLSSASSKTAYGLAWCLRDCGLPVIGLTSDNNRDFVAGLDLYSEVVCYSDLTALDSDTPALYVDFASSPALRLSIHSMFGDTLKYDCLIGSTQGDSLDGKKGDKEGASEGLPGPAPAFFFAPASLEQHRENGTLHAFMARAERDQLQFFESARSSTPPWINIVEAQGVAAAQTVVEQLLQGGADPAQGYVIRLS